VHMPTLPVRTQRKTLKSMISN